MFIFGHFNNTLLHERRTVPQAKLVAVESGVKGGTVHSGDQSLTGILQVFCIAGDAPQKYSVTRPSLQLCYAVSHRRCCSIVFPLLSFQTVHLLHLFSNSIDLLLVRGCFSTPLLVSHRRCSSIVFHLLSIGTDNHLAKSSLHFLHILKVTERRVRLRCSALSLFASIREQDGYAGDKERQVRSNISLEMNREA